MKTTAKLAKLWINNTFRNYPFEAVLVIMLVMVAVACAK